MIGVRFRGLVIRIFYHMPMILIQQTHHSIFIRILFLNHRANHFMRIQQLFCPRKVLAVTPNLHNHVPMLVDELLRFLNKLLRNRREVVVASVKCLRVLVEQLYVHKEVVVRISLLSHAIPNGVQINEILDRLSVCGRPYFIRSR